MWRVAGAIPQHARKFSTINGSYDVPDESGVSENNQSARPHWRRLTRRMLIQALTIYLLFVLLLFLVQRRFIFPASHTIGRTPADPPYKYEYEDVMLTVGDDLTSAWFMDLPESRGAVLFSHGNGGNIADWFEVAGAFRELGLSVLVYDYGGYGRSTGRPSEKRCYADIRAAWKYLTDNKNIPPQKIVLVGRSVGGGPTVQLATEVAPAAVILESTFTSLPAVAQRRLFIFPVKLLMRDRFENDKKIGRIRAPIMIIHSADDSLIPIKHARRLFDLANQPKKFVQIKGDHNDAYIVFWHAYQAALRDFLSPLFD